MTIGIVGYGSFGAFLELLMRRFLPEAQIKIHSSRFEADGEKFFSLEDVATCDAVLLAVPIHAYEATLQKLSTLLGEQTVVVDVATVKVYTVGLLEKILKGKRYLATHPMFGPESYQKKQGDVSGLRVVVCEHTLPEETYKKVVEFLKQCGFIVVETTSAQHDKHLAETLFLTHFVGQIIARGGFNRTEIDTVSFGYLMDATESVKHDTELFKDVYHYNPFCEEVLKKFEVSETQVHALLRKNV